ncbi:hypothetical protein BKH46_04690 [Helicobacter sp. 12S02634-8]|uniref:glycosyltransferase family 2 protein n=1 Tax=Helicobacter sp. 12S02634-8 TaxID=1476199 RepID=UPI000BA65ED6|nr:glycosyltransferase family 2 protein [Helicobacter sp. 12S02634-8]PAF47380.1 hypothetical protein BKH46_04690 [Helicobacter sp. 12S02634-8]
MEQQVAPVLALIVPCYNEESLILSSLQTLYDKLDSLKDQNIIATQSFIICIDDGSTDQSPVILQDFAHHHPFCTLIKLAKNYGHQNALLAGLKYAHKRCDCCISIDGDLQQDIDKIPEFIAKYSQGAQIVLGIRNDRKTDGFFKKWSAYGFYTMMQLLGTPTIKNHADYRLLGSKALERLMVFKESNLFLRGLILELGAQVESVYFDVKPRTAGESKYSLKKMLALAINGITSFSIRPLHCISIGGGIVFFVSFLLGVYSFYIALFTDQALPGWASIALPLYFLGGIQLLALGVIGEYIGKIYAETKQRPPYLIDSITASNSQRPLSLLQNIPNTKDTQNIKDTQNTKDTHASK